MCNSFGYSSFPSSPVSRFAKSVPQLLVTPGVLGLWLRHSSLCLCCHVAVSCVHVSLFFLQGHQSCWVKAPPPTSPFQSNLILTNDIRDGPVSK